LAPRDSKPFTTISARSWASPTTFLAEPREPSRASRNAARGRSLICGHYRGGQTRNEWGGREYVERFVVSCLNVDASSWFSSGAGARLDPRDEANRSEIENNIQTSFKAFKDDDHDGHPDA